MHTFEKDLLVRRASERIARSPKKSSNVMKRIIRDVVNRSGLTQVQHEKEEIILQVSKTLAEHNGTASTYRAEKRRKAAAAQKRTMQ